MLAYVLVTDAPYFAGPTRPESWSVEAPQGTYQVSVWQPRMEETLQKEVTIDADRSNLTVRLTER